MMRLIVLFFVMTFISCSTTTTATVNTEKPISGVVTSSGDQSPPLSYYVTSRPDKPN